MGVKIPLYGLGTGDWRLEIGDFDFLNLDSCFLFKTQRWNGIILQQ
jgi:hypothetical protein